LKLPPAPPANDSDDIASDEDSAAAELPDRSIVDEAGPIDIGEILADDLDTLALFKSNSEDPYLSANLDTHETFDAEELDDLVVRPTDALIIAAKSGEDASMLEFHLLEDDAQASDSEESYKPHYYVHHDLVLPTLPLCTAYTALDIDSSRLNLVAVGCFSPGIDIWDVDRVNVLEPVISLGGYDVDAVDGGLAEQVNGNESRAKRGSAKGRKNVSAGKKLAMKRRSQPQLRDGSHTDAVMSLSWNNVQREYLASGSADSTVKIWDVESGHCASTLRHHSDKVQSVSWHLAEDSTLLTGSFDRSVHVVDVRAAGPTCSSWRVRSDVEACQWGCGPLAGLLIATTEDGVVYILNRQKASTILVEWQAHDGAVSACAQSNDVPGMLVTGSVDRTLKVWDVRECMDGSAPKLIYERPSKAGAVFAAALRPLSTSGQAETESAFVLAYAGAKGLLVVLDLAIESEAVREAFASHISTGAGNVMRSRIARLRRGGVNGTNRTQWKMADGSEEDVIDSDGESSDSAGSGSDEK
jgi:periodic tryptophan protein 1